MTTRSNTRSIMAEDNQVNDEVSMVSVFRNQLNDEGSMLRRRLLDNIFSRNKPKPAVANPKLIFISIQLMRDGAEKTVILNFKKLCESIRQEPDEVMAILLNALGTSGSLDEQQRLVIMGSPTCQHVVEIWKQYVINRKTYKGGSPSGRLS